LVEHLGPLDRYTLQSVVDVVGGVPEILQRLGTLGTEALTQVTHHPESVWRVLGQLAIEIRGAFEIVAADSALSDRLEQLAKGGPLPQQPAQDFALMRAGLIKQSARNHTSQLRAPVFSKLALAG
jgi:hypothetical protein